MKRVNRFYFLVFTLIGLVALFFVGARNAFAASTGYGWVMFESSSGTECNALTSHMVFRLYNEGGASIPGNITVNGVSGGNVLDLGCQDPGGGFDVSASGAGYQNFSTLYRYTDSVVSSSKGKYLNTAVYLTNNLTTQITSPADGAVLTSSSVSFNFFANNLSEGGSQLDAYFYIDGQLMQNPPPVFSEGNFSMGPYTLGNGNHTAMLIFVGKGGRLPVSAKAEISFNVNTGGGSVTNTLNVNSTPVSAFSMIDSFGAASTPFTRTSINSIVETVEATQNETVGGVAYTFSSWTGCNDDTNPDRFCSVRVENGATLTITANYTVVSAPSLSPNPSITGRHVNTSGGLFTPGTQFVTVTGPTNVSSSENPFTFNNLSPGGPYRVEATQITGYTISVATCVNSTCNAGSTFNSGNIVSNLILNPGNTADIWFKYTPAPVSPSPSPSATPSPPSGSSSTTNIECDGFTANWSAVTGATQYRVKVINPSGTTSYVPAGTATSKVFDWLLPGTYTWSAEAYVNNVYQEFGGTHNVTTTGCATPPPPSVPPGTCATFYDGVNFTGPQKTLYADVQYLNDVDYDDFRNILSLDNTVSSIRVPAGVTVTVYLDGNYVGSSTVRSSDWSDMGVTWSNKISSVKISGCGPAPPVRSIYGRKVVQPGFNDFGTAPGEIPPGTNVYIFSGSSQIYTDGPQTGEFFKTNLASGAYRVQAMGVPGWLLQACVGASASASENVCTPVLAEGEGASVPVTHDSATREITVWFYFQPVPAPPSNLGCVALFTGEAYTGTRVDITADATVLPANINNLSRSIALAPGVSATVYNNNNFGAPSKSILASLAYLNGYTYDGSATSLEYTISSIKVFGCAVATPTPNPPSPPPGASPSPSPTPPTNPTGLLLTTNDCSAVPTGPKVVLSWTHPAGSTADQYFIGVSTDNFVNDNNWGWQVVNASSPTYTWSSQTPMLRQSDGSSFVPLQTQAYYWRVLGYNSATGQPSQMVYFNGNGNGGTTIQAQATTFTTQNCTPPAEPTSLTVTLDCTGVGNSPMVKFSWNHPAGSTANTYYLDVSGAQNFPPGYGGATIIDLANPHFDWSSGGQLSGIPASPVSGESYFWRVRAYNSVSGLYSTSHVYWNGLATGGTVAGTTNQELATTITVQDCGNDITIDNADTDPDTYVKLYRDAARAIEEDHFNIGETIYVKVRTKNLGSTNTGPFDVAFYNGTQSPSTPVCDAVPPVNNDMSPLPVKPIANLGPGLYDDFELSFKTPGEGSFTAYGFADYKCDVPEPEEDNNLQQAGYVVGSKAFYITNAGDVASGNGAGGGGTLSLTADPGPGKFQSSYLLGGETLANVKSAKPWYLSGYTQPFMPAVLEDYLRERFYSKFTNGELANRHGTNPADGCIVSFAPKKNASDPASMNWCPYNARYEGAPGMTGDAVWYIDGNLTIAQDLILSSLEDTLVLIVKGNITIETNVERVDAILISGSQFQSASSGNTLGDALTINGAVFAPSVRLIRTLTVGSDTNPSEIITLDPKYIIKLPKILGTPAITWEEIAP